MFFVGVEKPFFFALWCKHLSLLYNPDKCARPTPACIFFFCYSFDECPPPLPPWLGEDVGLAVVFVCYIVKVFKQLLPAVVPPFPRRFIETFSYGVFLVFFFPPLSPGLQHPLVFVRWCLKCLPPPTSPSPSVVDFFPFFFPLPSE